MRKWIVPLIIVGLIVAAAYFGTGRRFHHDPLPEQKPAPRQDPEKTEKDIERAVREYAPKSLTKIDDLSVSIEPILAAIPAVEKVIVTGAKSPTSRIIHIADLHFVDKDVCKIDMEHAHGRKLSESEFDEMYRDLLLGVECVQIEQTGLLRCLDQHGLRAVFLEGFSVGGREGIPGMD
jgi:hypothetical protein